MYFMTRNKRSCRFNLMRTILSICYSKRSHCFLAHPRDKLIVMYVTRDMTNRLQQTYNIHYGTAQF